MAATPVHRVTLANGTVLNFAAVANKLRFTLADGSTVWLVLEES